VCKLVLYLLTQRLEDRSIGIDWAVTIAAAPLTNLKYGTALSLHID
jgi:hypothetical protein